MTIGGKHVIESPVIAYVPVQETCVEENFREVITDLKINCYGRRVVFMNILCETRRGKRILTFFFFFLELILALLHSCHIMD